MAPQHRWACWVAFVVQGEVRCSVHAHVHWCTVVHVCWLGRRGTACGMSVWSSCIGTRLGACGCGHCAPGAKVSKDRFAPVCGRHVCTREVRDIAQANCVSVCYPSLRAFARPETMEHALHCVARFVRVLLGPTSVAAKKLACGRELDVLGVTCVVWACRACVCSVRI